MTSFYGRTNATLARAHATLDRLSGIEADIAERARREALGLLPQYTPAPPPEPTQAAEEEINPETPITAGVMKDLIYLLRCEFGQQLDALREEVQAALNAKATATTSTQDHSDDHASGT